MRPVIKLNVASRKDFIYCKSVSGSLVWNNVGLIWRPVYKTIACSSGLRDSPLIGLWITFINTDLWRPGTQEQQFQRRSDPIISPSQYGLCQTCSKLFIVKVIYFSWQWLTVTVSHFQLSVSFLCWSAPFQILSLFKLPRTRTSLPAGSCSSLRQQRAFTFFSLNKVGLGILLWFIPYILMPKLSKIFACWRIMITQTNEWRD